MNKTNLFQVAALSVAVLAAPLAFAQTATTVTTTSAGTISEFSPDALVIRSETSTTPVRYGYTKSTVYVDETGAPVSRELVRSGLPVTVQYVQEGDRMIANRVIVRRTTTTSAPAVIERNTTVTTPPVVIDRPVVVEKPVIVERPVVVTPAQPPVLIEKKTTTTTTTNRDDD